jgi:replicative DNA helicase
MEQPRYNYAESFQQRIAALCLKDPIFIQDYDDIVNPRFFDYDYLSSIIRVAKHHVTRHNEIPSKATLVESMRDFCLTYKVSPEDTQDIFDKVDRLYAIDLIDPMSVKERVIRFGQRQALKSALMESADIIDNDSEHEKCLELVQNALQIGQSTQDLGINAFGRFQELPGLMARSGVYDKSKKIPTMIPELDRAVYGGPGRKEVWMLMGLPGIGKSQWLLNMGVAGLNQGFNVIHITIGDLDEIDVWSRYSARLTHLPIDEVIKNSKEYQRRAKKIDSFIEKYLRIKYYSAGSVTIGMIRAYLSRLVTVDGIRPDLLLLDYPDKMKRLSDNDYTNMGMIYTDICGLAGDYNLLVWVASQVQRWSPKKEEEYITQDNVADSWRKAQDVDGVVSFNQTVEEYQRGRARAWVDKVRRGRKHFLIQLSCDFAMSYIRQLTAQELKKEKEDLAVKAEQEKKDKKNKKKETSLRNQLEADRLKKEAEKHIADEGNGT